VARARELLHEQISDESSLDDLAAEVGVTKPYLVRAFAREVGLPPHEYQMHLRVARASRLLARRLPAGEVAHEVGFYDQSHLNRWFKKVIGVTPGQYAKAIL
jgi:AraC-like DNA-binding protein